MTSPPNDPVRRAREALARYISWELDVERPTEMKFLPDGEREAFLAYYRALPARDDAAGRARYERGMWRGEAGWPLRWLANAAVAAQVSGRAVPRVLDAGCGFGSFSLLFAEAGVHVRGVDLRPDRLDSARRRLAFHAEATGRRLDIEYVRGDVTVPTAEPPDLVWVYNAISHIDPPESFLGSLRQQITPGGRLVIGDINGRHPSQAPRLASLRQDVHQEYVAPDGTRHAYAVERAFSPDELRSLVIRSGWRVVHHEIYPGGAGSLPGPLWLATTPLRRYSGWNAGIARRQLLVAAPS